MTGLRDRLANALDKWHEQLPAAWQPLFAGVELDFDAVVPTATLDVADGIWPVSGAGPAGAHVFKSLLNADPARVRVVVFGNDPYTHQTQATGRSFEQGDLTDWATDIRRRGRISPSMQSIVAAAAATAPVNARYSLCDTRMVYDQEEHRGEAEEQPLWFAHIELARGFADGALRLRAPNQIFDYWANQGVLWLNRTLTYTKWDDAHRESHRCLWAPFTARMLEVLVDLAKDHPIVFVLWGSGAADLENVVEKLAASRGVPRNRVRMCKTGHPQWPAGYFAHGNPLAAINKAIGTSGPAISWV